MTEPTSAAASAVGAGAGALILSMLGVEAQALLWAAVGASVGITLAPQSGRLRAALTFGSVVLLSALAGTYVAHEHLAGSVVARNAISAATAMLFHPLFTAAVAGVPALVASIAARIGGARP